MAMREILFRGKHKATGKWCEGNLHIDKQGEWFKHCPECGLKMDGGAADGNQ